MKRRPMHRREFLLTSAGFLATPLLERGVWSIERPESIATRFDFEPYRESETMAPVTKVTPDDGFYVHTYYDVCPFSPSGRYLAVTRLPYQDRVPVLGDTADVCVIDLEHATIRAVYTTKSWGFQTGSNVQWGMTDRHVYTNDVVGDRAVCVRLDLETGESTAFGGPMYHIAPDESSVIGFPLELLDITQRGYGVPPKDPDRPRKLPPGASRTQGLWKTDLKTGKSELLVPLAALARLVPEPPPEKGGTFYLWHSKFNRQGTRIMQVLRCMLPSGRGGRNAMVLTFKPDGTDIRYAPGTPVWGAGGGHPNWHPDGEHLIRVMRVDGKTPRLCKYRYDAGSFTVMSEKILGGGHPTFEGKGRYIVTDQFHGRRPQKVSIQLIDMEAEKAAVVCTLTTLPRADDIPYQPHRLDGHPTWSRDHGRVCFQAAPRGRRQLFVAEMKKLIG